MEILTHLMNPNSQPKCKSFSRHPNRRNHVRATGRQRDTNSVRLSKNSGGQIPESPEKRNDPEAGRRGFEKDEDTEEDGTASAVDGATIEEDHDNEDLGGEFHYDKACKGEYNLLLLAYSCETDWTAFWKIAIIVIFQNMVMIVVICEFVNKRSGLKKSPQNLFAIFGILSPLLSYLTAISIINKVSLKALDHCSYEKGRLLQRVFTCWYGKYYNRRDVSDDDQKSMRRRDRLVITEAFSAFLYLTAIYCTLFVQDGILNVIKAFFALTLVYNADTSISKLLIADMSGDSLKYLRIYWRDYSEKVKHQNIQKMRHVAVTLIAFTLWFATGLFLTYRQ